ncbi:MAG: hypothetical protein ACOYO0_14910, partial [Sandarakinorhabdus sp.]
MKAEELLAAALLQYVSEEHNGVFRGPTIELLKYGPAHLDFYDVYEFNDKALNILRSLEVATDHRHAGMQPYIVVECDQFRSKFKKGPIGFRYYSLDNDLHYKGLESYAEFGRSWLIDAIYTFKHDIIDNKSGEAENFVPAADRIVTLSDNQISALEQPFEDVVEIMESHNGDP